MMSALIREPVAVGKSARTVLALYFIIKINAVMFQPDLDYQISFAKYRLVNCLLRPNVNQVFKFSLVFYAI